MKKLALLFVAFNFVTPLFPQSIAPDILTKQWEASWIAVPGEPASGYGIYLFRKSIQVNPVPTSFIIHVSADNRYKLYVNEKLVSL